AEAWHAVGQVDVEPLTELLALRGREHGVDHRLRVLAFEAAFFGCGHERAVHPHHRIAGCPDVKVGCPRPGRRAQQLVAVHGGRWRQPPCRADAGEASSCTWTYRSEPWRSGATPVMMSK